jgi:hypothetical protein
MSPNTCAASIWVSEYLDGESLDGERLVVDFWMGRCQQKVIHLRSQKSCQASEVVDVRRVVRTFPRRCPRLGCNVLPRAGGCIAAAGGGSAMLLECRRPEVFWVF